jgi:hypothetical protein
VARKRAGENDSDRSKCCTSVADSSFRTRITVPATDSERLLPWGSPPSRVKRNIRPAAAAPACTPAALLHPQCAGSLRSAAVLRHPRDPTGRQQAASASPVPPQVPRDRAGPGTRPAPGPRCPVPPHSPRRGSAAHEGARVGWRHFGPRRAHERRPVARGSGSRSGGWGSWSGRLPGPLTGPIGGRLPRAAAAITPRHRERRYCGPVYTVGGGLGDVLLQLHPSRPRTRAAGPPPRAAGPPPEQPARPPARPG